MAGKERYAHQEAQGDDWATWWFRGPSKVWALNNKWRGSLSWVGPWCVWHWPAVKHRDTERDETRWEVGPMGKGTLGHSGKGARKLLQGQRPREDSVVSSFSFCYIKSWSQLGGALERQSEVSSKAMTLLWKGQRGPWETMTSQRIPGLTEQPVIPQTHDVGTLHRWELYFTSGCRKTSLQSNLVVTWLS